MGLKEFLIAAKDNVTSPTRRGKVHIVIGNESCDLDSSVSAITYAYFLHQTKARPGTTFAPVLNTPRENFRLKLETVAFLGKHGIGPQDLTFISDLDLTLLTSDSSLAVTLVDHHTFGEAEACLEPFVERVFDHRPQDGTLPDSWAVTLEPVGSCCSLVARELLSSDNFELDATVAELLLGTILADTGNMSASDRIGTPADHEQLVKLKAFLPSSISATTIYEEIRDSKFDLSSLTVKEMLYKDMKMLRGTGLTVAMCSVTKDLEEILATPEFSQHAEEFCKESSTDVVIIMTILTGEAGIRRRCVAVFSLNRVHREQITDVLLRSTAPDLDLQIMTSPLPDLDTTTTSAFIQNNVVISRKGVLPLIRNFLTGEVDSPDTHHDFFTSGAAAVEAGAATATVDLSGKSPSASRESENVEEVCRHINLAKASQSEQFRTSQDRFDLAAVGSSAVISPSLSSDSDIGGTQAVSGFSLTHPDLPIAEGIFVGGPVTPDKQQVTSDVDAGQSSLVEGLSFGDGGENRDSLLLRQIKSNEDDGFEAAETEKSSTAGRNVNGNSTETPPIVINCHSPFELMCPTNVADTMMTDFFASSMPTSAYGSGQGSKVPSYPETPPNSYMGSSFSLNRETQLPSFNSSEMVKRIQQKKATLAGHSDRRRNRDFDDDYDDECGGIASGGLYTGGGSSGGGGSLISPAVPQNSYVDPSRFDLLVSASAANVGSSGESLVERVNEKRSQFEWSGEGERSGLSSREDEEEDHQLDSGRHHRGRGGESVMDPPVPYTPQNSYVDGGFDTFSRSNLPSMNSAEMVARIKAKQSAMFGSSGQRGSSEDSGSGSGTGRAVASPRGGNSRGASLDSPQQPYTPQNSYRDSMGLLELRNKLPDLNEVAERLTTERHSGAKLRNLSSSSSSGSGVCRAADDNNYDLTGLPPLEAVTGAAVLSSNPHLPHLQMGAGGHHHHNRKSSSRSHSDSQNTMSDVESLVSMVGTPQMENVVAAGIVGQILNREIGEIGRKDTTDSDVFSMSAKAGEEIDNDDDDDDDDVDEGSKVFNNKDISQFGGLDNRRPADLGSDPLMMVVPNGPVQDETIRELSGIGGVSRGQCGSSLPVSISKEELFSPVNPRDADFGFVGMAENIVAESIAAALRFSHGNGLGVGGAVVSASGNCVPLLDEGRMRNTDNNNQDLGQDDEETIICAGAENIVADSIAAALRISSSQGLVGFDGLGDNPVSLENVVMANLSSIVQEGSDRWPSRDGGGLNGTVAKVRGSSTDIGYNGCGGDGGKTIKVNGSSDLGVDLQVQGMNVVPIKVNGGSVVSEANLSEAALNELAYEIAHELIQNVLENFHQAGGGGGNDVGADSGPSRRVGVVNNMMLGGNPSLVETATPLSGDTNDTESVLSWQQQTSLSSSSDPRKLSTDSTVSSVSTTCSDRKFSRDPADLASTIIEGEVMTSFPERSDLDEEDIVSFPGRKFSKSEDYPSRRFSREERGSKAGGQKGEGSEETEGEEFSEIKVAPDGLETDYLPGMDPLQGNLDIIDASFTKITDADREVVEGESFRKVSGQEFGVSALASLDKFSAEGNSGVGETTRQVVSVAPALKGGIMERDNSEESSSNVFSQQTQDQPGPAVTIPRQKKKIRVSFSEDIEDEIGDFNAATTTMTSASGATSSSSPRSSVLRSPPPFSQREHLGKGGSDDDKNEDEDDEDDDYAGEEKEEGAVERGQGAEGGRPRDVYSTAAGRIISEKVITPNSSPPQYCDNDFSSSPTLPHSLSHAQFDNPTSLAKEHAQTNISTSLEQEHTDSDNPTLDTEHGSISNDSALSLDKSLATTTDSENDSQIDTVSSKHAHNLSAASRNETVEINSDSPLQPSHNTTASSTGYSLNFDPSVNSDPASLDPSVNPDLKCRDPNVECAPPPPISNLSVFPQCCNKGNQDKTLPADVSTNEPPRPRPTQVSALQQASYHPLMSGVVRSHSRNLSGSTSSFCSVKGAVYSEEWQDDEIAGIAAQHGIEVPTDDRQRRTIHPDPIGEDDDDDGDIDDIEAVDDSHSDILMGDLEWEKKRLLPDQDETPIPEDRPRIGRMLSDESADVASSRPPTGDTEATRWKRVSVSGSDFNIDLQAVDPYRGVLSHGGYFSEGLSAIIVFYGCNLPSRRKDNYAYVMNHLFHYVVHTLEELVAQDYVIVYFHGSTPRHKMPGLGWLRRCYQSIDRRLKKDLKGLYLVHPTLWLRTVVTMTRPFISSKFSSKLRFIKTLEELNSTVPMDNIKIPDSIAHYDIHHRHLASPPESPSHGPLAGSSHQ